MKQVVDLYFSRAANKIVDLIKKRWKKHPDIQCFYVIGEELQHFVPILLKPPARLNCASWMKVSC